jgi:FtsZ-binding cell division protein ZapB
MKEYHKKNRELLKEYKNQLKQKTENWNEILFTKKGYKENTLYIV